MLINVISQLLKACEDEFSTKELVNQINKISQEIFRTLSLVSKYLAKKINKEAI